MALTLYWTIKLSENKIPLTCLMYIFLGGQIKGYPLSRLALETFLNLSSVSLTKLDPLAMLPGCTCGVKYVRLWKKRIFKTTNKVDNLHNFFLFIIFISLISAYYSEIWHIRVCFRSIKFNPTKKLNQKIFCVSKTLFCNFGFSVPLL